MLVVDKDILISPCQGIILRDPPAIATPTAMHVILSFDCSTIYYYFLIHFIYIFLAYNIFKMLFFCTGHLSKLDFVILFYLLIWNSFNNLEELDK